MEERTQEEIEAALLWLGYPTDTEVDQCENGSVYVGLTQILPPRRPAIATK